MSSSRRIVVLLAASAALNLFLLGAATVHFIHHRGAEDEHEHARDSSRSAARGVQMPPHQSGRARFRERHLDRGPPEARLLRDIVRSMGGPKDPRVQALLQKNREEIHDFRRDIREAQGQVRAALAKRPYDEPAVQEALAALRNETNAGQARAQAALVELAAQLSDDERAQLEKAASHEKRPRDDEFRHD